MAVRREVRDEFGVRKSIGAGETVTQKRIRSRREHVMKLGAYSLILAVALIRNATQGFKEAF